MVKLNKIYTRTGDAGETGLVDGSRIRKDDPLAQAIGDVDETNSAIGVALQSIADTAITTMLGRIQNELFDLGADLATPGTDFTPGEMTLRVVQSQIDRLEWWLAMGNVRVRLGGPAESGPAARWRGLYPDRFIDAAVD